MHPKQLSGYQKRKKRKQDEEMIKSQAGAIHKFMHKHHVEEADVEVEHVEEANVEVEHVEANVNEEHVEEPNVEVEHVEANVNEEHVEGSNPMDIFDPRRWEGLNSDKIKLLVEKGPKRDINIMYGPYTHGRRFSVALYTRTLPNLEKCDREWLVYSKELDKIFCFCCKLFRKGAPKGGLDGEGFNFCCKLFRKEDQDDCFPNASIAYRVLLTIPVTVASAERSFSKLKLLKSYLRSTMSQERLSGLAMIAIENEILETINYEEVINQFAIKNARRASRISN